MNETNKVDMNASNKNNQPETVSPSDTAREPILVAGEGFPVFGTLEK